MKKFNKQLDHKINTIRITYDRKNNVWNTTGYLIGYRVPEPKRITKRIEKNYDYGVLFTGYLKNNS